MNWSYLLTSFDGRIGRQTFWLAFLPVFLAEVAAYSLAYRIDGERLAAIAELAFTYPEFAIFAKRGHDRGIPTMLIGAFFALGVALDFLIVIGWSGTPEEPSALLSALTLPWLVAALALMIELGLRRGVAGPNQYGPDPLAKSGTQT